MLNWLLSSELELFVDLDIKLYLGTREISLCLWPLNWKRVEVTLTLILHKFITSANQLKFKENYWYFTFLDVILIYNRSTNWLSYFMLRLDIIFSCSLNVGTCDVMKWQLNCSLVVLFSTLQYQVTILQYQLTHSCLVMLLLCFIYVRYVFGLGGINIK